jgi:hypothetical protein
MPQHTDKPTTAPLVEWVFSLAVAASVAALWVGLFKFNSIFFEYLGVSQYISWVFLPAAIRMISVMLFDWVGAAGLFVGAVITSDPVLNHNFSDAITLAGMSALGPVLAVTFCTKWLRMSENFSGLGPRQLTLFGLVGALCNVIPHNIYFYVTDRMQSPLAGVIPMFVGDLLGTVIVLYVSALVLKYVFPERQKLDQTLR